MWSTQNVSHEAHEDVNRGKLHLRWGLPPVERKSWIFPVTMLALLFVSMKTLNWWNTVSTHMRHWICSTPAHTPTQFGFSCLSRSLFDLFSIYLYLSHTHTHNTNIRYQYDLAQLDTQPCAGSGCYLKILHSYNPTGMLSTINVVEKNLRSCMPLSMISLSFS